MSSIGNPAGTANAAETVNTVEIANAAEISRLEKEVERIQTKIAIKRLEHTIKNKQRKLKKLRKSQKVQSAAEKPANAGGSAAYDGEQYEIEAIVNKRASSTGGYEYLIKWKGWGERFNEWILDVEMAHCAAELVEEFEEENGEEFEKENGEELEKENGEE